MLPELSQRLLAEWTRLFPGVERPGGIHYLGITGSIEGGTTTFLGFPKGAEKPLFAVKMHRDARARQRVRREREVLDFLRQQATTLATSVPRVLLCDRISGAWLLVQTIIEGHPMSAAVRDDGVLEVNDTARNARIVAMWLARLHQIQRADPAQASILLKKRAARSIEDFSRLFRLSRSEGRYLNGLADVLDSALGGQVVIEHGDFCRQNILISNRNGQTKVGVIDWTDARLAGFPVHDLFFFLALYFLRVREHASLGELVRTFENTFLRRNPYNSVVRRCIATYCQKAGIDREALEMLFALFLVNRAVFESRQVMRCASRGVLPRFTLYLAALENLDFATAIRAPVWLYFFRRFVAARRDFLGNRGAP